MNLKNLYQILSILSIIASILGYIKSNKKGKYIMFIGFIILALVFWKLGEKTDAVIVPPNPAVITQIPDTNINITLGQNYKLPDNVTANLDDSTKKLVPVKWENVKDISIPGSYTFYGTVEGYDKKAKLILNVTLPYLSDLKPTASNNADFNVNIKSGSNEYYHTIKEKYETEKGYVTYDLGGKYKKLTGILGTFYTDTQTLFPPWVKISLDGKQVKAEYIKQDSLPQNLDLDVTGINELKIEGSAWYIADPVLN